MEKSIFKDIKETKKEYHDTVLMNVLSTTNIVGRDAPFLYSVNLTNMSYLVSRAGYCVYFNITWL